MTRRRIIAGLAVVALGAGAWFAFRPAATATPPDVPLQDVDPELAEAVSGARKHVLDDPRDGAAWGRLGEVLGDNDFPMPAAECFTQAAKLDPDNPRWHFLHALQMIEAGRGGDALPMLRRAVASSRNRDEKATALTWAAATCIEEGKLDEAAKLLEELGSAEPGGARREYYSALLMIASGDRPAARRILSGLMDHPNCRQRVHQLLATLTENDPERAAHLEREARRPPPDLPWPNAFVPRRFANRVPPANRIHRFMGLMQQGRPEQAIEFLRSEVERSPDADVCQRLGIVHYENKEYDDAARLFRQSLQFNDRNPNSHQLLAATLFFQGEPKKEKGLLEQAVTETDAAIAISPGLSYSHFIRGRALYALNRKPEAIVAMREAVTCTPNAFEPNMHLGEWLVESGQAAEGIKHLELAVRLADPEDPRPKAALQKWKK